MSESKFEQRTSKRLEARGWMAVKLMQTNKNGIPDRMYLRDGQIFFIEFKSAIGRLSEVQNYRIKELRDKHFHVFIFKEPKK